jgi:hypothetical protein
LDGGGSIPGRGKRFSVLYSVQTGSRPHPASYPMNTWGFSPGGKSSWGVKLTTHFNPVPKSRMVELYFNSPIRLHGVVLN